MNNDIFFLNKNETELKFDNTENSSKENFFIFVKKDEKLLKSSSFEITKMNLSPIEKEIIEYHTKKEQENLIQLINKLTHELVIELKYFSVNDNEISPAERKMLDIEEKYSFRILGEVLQRIYITYYNYPTMLAGICKGLEHFDLEETFPWGHSILLGVINHKSEIVKEYVVSLIENWSNVTLLPLLRNIECSSLWLKEYISDVIKYLEVDNVLHKKII